MSIKSEKKIDEIIDDITIDLEKIEKSKNINIILKKHKNIKNKLDETNKSINELKYKFENYESGKIILSDNDFILNINKINDLSDDTFNELALEDQIIKYMELMDIINNCKEYIDVKKMDIVKC